MFAGIPEFIFSVAAKLSLGLLIFSALLLFAPDSFLQYLGLTNFLQGFHSQVSILFLLSAAIFTSAIIKFLWEKAKALVSLHLKKSAKKAEEAEAMAKIAKRLGSLTLSEKQWIQYCLYYNQQTFIASVANSTGNSLANKALVCAGEGHVMSIPFTFPDHVWDYLVKNKEKFLPQLLTADKISFESQLSGFKRSQGVF
jgi:hypothetical protein